MSHSIINPVTFLQIKIVRIFMDRYCLTPEQFIEWDKTAHIFEFLRDGYEPFHLTGEEGILEELENHIRSYGFVH